MDLITSIYTQSIASATYCSHGSVSRRTSCFQATAHRAVATTLGEIRLKQRAQLARVLLNRKELLRALITGLTKSLP